MRLQPIYTNRQRKNYLLYDLSVNPSIDLALVQRLQDQLREIEKGRIEGEFHDSTGAIVSGQTIIHQLLSEAHEIVGELLVFQDVGDTSELSDMMRDLASKESLVGYLQSVAKESRKVSLPTVHFLQDSLGSCLAMI
jgi:hypothetical protein